MINREPQLYLRRLTLHDLCIKSGAKFFDIFLGPLGQLTHLDLSSAFHALGMQGWVKKTRMRVMMMMMMMMMVLIMTMMMAN